MKFICVFGSSSESIDRRYLTVAEELGVFLAKKNCGVVYGAGKYAFIPYLAVIVIVAAILLSSLTIIFACLNMLTTNAITLLAPPVPKTRKHRGRARQALFLYPKLLVMNMLSDKKRVIATIVSVMGCCTLLAAGFGMQFAIKDSISNQFVLYEHYDYKVKYDRELNPQADEQVLEANRFQPSGTRSVRGKRFLHA